jgi:hypothetical protein
MKRLLLRAIAPIMLRFSLWLTGVFIKHADLRDAGCIPLNEVSDHNKEGDKWLQ